jgi:DUF1680 family protein
VRGCVAVERGPLVLCVESVDLPDQRHVDDVRVDPAVPPRDENGVVVSGRLVDQPNGEWPYFDGPNAEAGGDEVDVRLVPYNSWATRGPSTMRVWLPTV